MRNLLLIISVLLLPSQNFAKLQESCSPCSVVHMMEMPHPHISYFSESSPPENVDFDIFPVSSEMQIGKVQHMIQRVPCGLYLTVGSERGGRAASMSEKITALYLLDIHDDIIRFNVINRELLKSPTRHEYLYLRWESTYQDWQNLFQSMRSKYGHEINISYEDFLWWEQNVRELAREGYVLPEYLNRVGSAPLCTDTDITDEEKNLDLGQILDYKTGNYLFYSDLYDRLHQLAIQNKIYTSKINLLDGGQLIQLLAYLRSLPIPISVLDLDNLYFEDYLGQDAYHRLLPYFLPLGRPSSVFLVMNNYKDYACGQFQSYIGFTFENISHWPINFKMQDFTDSIPERVHDLIDGRLYEGEEKLPDFPVK
jgi:hypothetical protein